MKLIWACQAWGVQMALISLGTSKSSTTPPIIHYFRFFSDFFGVAFQHLIFIMRLDKRFLLNEISGKNLEWGANYD